MSISVTALGILVSIISITYNFPFAYRILKNGSARDVDPYFLSMRAVGTILYIIYGILINDIYVIISNVIPLVSTTIVIIVKVLNKYKRLTWVELTTGFVSSLLKYKVNPLESQVIELYNVLQSMIEPPIVISEQKQSYV